MSHCLAHLQRDPVKTSHLITPLLLAKLNDVAEGFIFQRLALRVRYYSRYSLRHFHDINKRSCDRYPSRKLVLAKWRVTGLPITDTGESFAQFAMQNAYFTAECYVYSVSQKPRFSARAADHAAKIAMPFIDDLVTPI